MITYIVQINGSNVVDADGFNVELITRGGAIYLGRLLSKGNHLPFGCFTIVASNGERFNLDGNQLTETPQYTHDCTRCQFLGRYKEFDLYYADHGGTPDTLIARFGNKGSEYHSGKGFVGIIDPITEAHKRAVELGLIKVLS